MYQENLSTPPLRVNGDGVKGLCNFKVDFKSFKVVFKAENDTSANHGVFICICHLNLSEKSKTSWKVLENNSSGDYVLLIIHTLS